jgi:hypothetical protein
MTFTHPLHLYRYFVKTTYGTMTCPCRMMAYVRKECSLGIVYFSPMHISERIIVGYDLSDTHEDLVNLTKP